MRKFFLATAAALSLAAIPTAAFASKPVTTHNEVTANANSHKGTPPTVMFVLHGSLSNLTASSTGSGSTGSGSGAGKISYSSVTITVTSANRDATALEALGPLTFTINAKTKVILDHTTFVAGRGIVKFRAKKNVDLTTLTSTTPAFQVIDQAAAKHTP
ncbi:MAG TPA: hypothetical protein VMU99_04715 [Acidimicrobiales bacterium]|nr:hypothetical protein [Acidimicrobiales bacterium]